MEIFCAILLVILAMIGFVWVLDKLFNGIYWLWECKDVTWKARSAYTRAKDNAIDIRNLRNHTVDSLNKIDSILSKKKK